MSATHHTTQVGNNGTGGTTVASAALSTTVGHCLLVISIAITNTSSQVVSSISGASLTWVAIPSAAISNGTNERMEKWCAFANGTITSQVITVTLSASAAASVVVSAYSGAPIGNNGLNAIGAVNTATGSDNAPTLNLTTNSNGSLVIACRIRSAICHADLYDPSPSIR